MENLLKDKDHTPMIEIYLTCLISQICPVYPVCPPWAMGIYILVKFVAGCFKQVEDSGYNDQTIDT